LKKNQKTLFIIVGVIIVIVIVLALTLSNSEKNTEEIKIGVITPLSGGPSLWGQGSLNMINLAVKEINSEGGINGKMLSVIPEDGKCQPEPSATAAQKLINVDEVKFILGGHCSPETAVLAAILETNKVFGIGGVSTATGILDSSSYAFRTSPPNIDQADLISKVALEKYNLQKVAVLTGSTAFTTSISNDFITTFEARGGEVLIREEYLWPETTDFRTHLIKIKDLNPDAIFISTQGTEGVQILKQIEELGIDATIIGNTVTISKRIYLESGEGLPSTSFTVAPYVNASSEKSSELIRKYK